MELIGTGREAQVYALDDRKVLRRSASTASGEAPLMRWLRAADYPVPEVFAASGGDLIMERLYGPTLAVEVIAGHVSASEAATMLIDLHERLHRIEAPDWLPGLPRHLDCQDRARSTAILHLDLHPENVILTEQGPYLVDWANAVVGAPSFDMAVSWAILAGVDFAAYGLPPGWVQTNRAELLAPFRAESSAAELEGAIRYREADPNIDAAEILRVRSELEAA